MAHLWPMYLEMKHRIDEVVRGDSGREEDIFRLLDVSQHLQQNWHTTQNELTGAKRILFTYENDMAQVRLENKELKGQLVEARSQIAGLVAVREDLEKQRGLLESQVDLVRDLLRNDVNNLPEYSRKRLQFLTDRPSAVVLPRNLSSTHVTERDIDYDRTDDSLDERSDIQNGRGTATRSKRSISITHLAPSAPGFENDDTPRKRSRDDMHIPIPNNIPGANYLLADGCRSPLNRSFSEPHNINANNFLQVPIPRGMKSVADLAALSPATSATVGRRHTFISKISLKAEMCGKCEKRFMFGSTMWRCEVCKMHCHAECRDHAMLPCVAHGTPTVKNHPEKLCDFVPLDPPMVPNVIVHCINEIERRGLTNIGLYRVPGSEAQVTELLEKFFASNRGAPNLRSVLDINVLAGCVKRFLHILKDRIIAPTSRPDILKAGTMKLDGQDFYPLLHQTISEMPTPNRDTLAFLMIHLKKVVTFSEFNKMTENNLAKIFGPTIIGSTVSTNKCIDEIGDELIQIEAAMRAMFELPPDYWGQYLTTSERTPLMGNRAAAGARNLDIDMGTSMLGPLHPETGTPKGYKIRKQQKFFNPPWK